MNKQKIMIKRVLCDTEYVDYLQVTVPCAMVAEGDKAYLEVNGELTLQEIGQHGVIGIITKGE